MFFNVSLSILSKSHLFIELDYEKIAKIRFRSYFPRLRQRLDDRDLS